jgi:hypothetical protein
MLLFPDDEFRATVHLPALQVVQPVRQSLYPAILFLSMPLDAT